MFLKKILEKISKTSKEVRKIKNNNHVPLSRQVFFYSKNKCEANLISRKFFKMYFPTIYFRYILKALEEMRN